MSGLGLEAKISGLGLGLGLEGLGLVNITAKQLSNLCRTLEQILTLGHELSDKTRPANPAIFYSSHTYEYANEPRRIATARSF